MSTYSKQLPPKFFLFFLFLYANNVFAQDPEKVFPAPVKDYYNQITAADKDPKIDSYVKRIKKLRELKIEAKKNYKQWLNSEYDNVVAQTLSYEQYQINGKRAEYQIDSLYQNSARNIYRRQANINGLRPFPAFNEISTKLYYNDIGRDLSFFQNNTVEFGIDKDNKAGFESEVVAAYAFIFRASLSTVLSREKVEKVNPADLINLTATGVDSLTKVVDQRNIVNNTINKVISGGGELNFSLRTPLLDINGVKESKFKFKSEFLGKLSFDVPEAGNSIDSKEANSFNSLSIENRAIYYFTDYSDLEKDDFRAKKVFGLGGQFNIRNIGGSEKFYNYLGTPNQRYFYYDFAIGIKFMSLFIYYSNQKFFQSALSNLNSKRVGVSLVQQF